MPAKLVLLDSNGLIYRAFFALPYLKTRDGRPTNAVYGLTAMVLKVLEDERPEYIAAAFDRPGPTFRHEQYAEYKAHREAMPDDLRPQIGLSKQVLDVLRIPVVEAEGFEAEDVIATIARRAEAEGMEVLVVSGDLDTLQLVGGQTRVMVTGRGPIEAVLYDEARVRERFGFAPARLPDYKSLRGDPSDNIPGVPGVGEKTASALIRQFGSVEALLDRLGEAPPRIRAALAAARDQVTLSKQLATIVANAPVEVDLEAFRRGEPDPGRLQALFQDLEFRGFLQRLNPRAAYEEPAAPSSASAAAQVAPDEIAAWARAAGEIGVAFLRENGHPLVARLRVAGIATEGRAGWLALDGGITGHLRAVLEDPAIRKVSADLKADLLALGGEGVAPAGFDYDVGIASYLLNPGKRTHTLATAAREFLGEDLLGPYPEAGSGLVLDPNAGASVAHAASALLRLRPVLDDRMREHGVQGLYSDVEIPLAGVLADMERDGVAADLPYLAALGEELSSRLNVLASDIYAQAGTEFNLGSPRQLSFVLFEKLHLPPLKRTKTGYSTDAEVLESLAPRHEVVAKIVAHRELSKLKSTYVDVLPRLADPRTGRVHTTFNQTLAATGRVITEQPNLQNLPIRTEEGRRIRRAIIAPSGSLLLSVDYSQIDLRVLAHITRDPGLVDAFARGEDVHAVTAAEVFGVARGAVSPELRRRAKAIVFGVAYGMSEHGLAGQLGIPREEARSFIGLYYARFPQVREYMLRVVEEARRDGFVTTLLNRRRYLPDLHSRNRAVREAAERVAINTPIQGSSADIIKLAMLGIVWQVLPAFPGARMTLQIHDELLFEVPGAVSVPVAQRVRAVMEQAFPLSVPLVAEAKAGPNWAEMQPVTS